MCAYQLGQLGSLGRRWPGTLADLEQAIADYEELTRRAPGDIDLLVALANSHREIGFYLYYFIDRSAARRLRHARRAKAIYERLARENPTATASRAEWARCLIEDANTGRPDATREEIEEHLREVELSVSIAREVVAADPDVPRYRTTLGQSLYQYGVMLADEGRREEGLAYIKEACDVLAQRDFAGSSFLFRSGGFQLLQARLRLAAYLAMAGHAGEALDAARKAAAMDDADTSPREAFIYLNATSLIHLLHSYLAFGAGERAEAAEAAERAAALLETLAEPNTVETWTQGCLHMIWYMQGRRAAPGRPAEPPGRPEHAAQAVALVRRAAERGYNPLGITAGFFGPVLGHLPDFRRLMMDLPFPDDPFVPLPEAPDDSPLPPAAGANS
jgi:tetratricopeptide (TPR) repeat protein